MNTFEFRALVLAGLMGVENVFNIEGVADRLKPETLSFLKSVLARSELLRDK